MEYGNLLKSLDVKIERMNMEMNELRKAPKSDLEA